MDINKIISIVRESRLNEMMTTMSTAGAPGFSSKADAEGPVAGLDAPMGCGEKKKKKKEEKEKKKEKGAREERVPALRVPTCRCMYRPQYMHMYRHM